MELSCLLSDYGYYDSIWWWRQLISFKKPALEALGYERRAPSLDLDLRQAAHGRYFLGWEQLSSHSGRVHVFI